MAREKKKLGRGLDALLGEGARALEAAPAGTAEQTLSDGSRLVFVDPRALHSNPQQPRQTFDEEALEELCASIKRDGIQEPVVVRPAGKGYELVSGERRVRASVMADLETIPAICREVTDKDMLRLGLIENIQREDLNAIELATAYQQLLDEFGWTQEQLADEVGKRRATVTNTLRLLNLPDVVQEMVADGSLSMGHARALLAIESPERQAAAARKVVSEELSVRQAERLAAGSGAKKNKTAGKPAKPRDPHLAGLEDDLRRRLGTKVTLKPGAQGRGKIEIEYFDMDELERLLEILRSR